MQNSSTRRNHFLFIILFLAAFIPTLASAQAGTYFDYQGERFSSVNAAVEAYMKPYKSESQGTKDPKIEYTGKSFQFDKKWYGIEITRKRTWDSGETDTELITKTDGVIEIITLSAPKTKETAGTTYKKEEPKPATKKEEKDSSNTINIYDKKGPLIGQFTRGEKMQIIGATTLHGGNTILLDKERTVTVTGSLNDVNTVALRGVMKDGSYNGATLADAENKGGMNILRSPAWNKIKQKHKLPKDSTGKVNYNWPAIADEFWETVNKPWLERAIQRGDKIRFVSNPRGDARFVAGDDGRPAELNGKKIPSIFSREIDLLKENGYNVLNTEAVKR